MANGESTNYYEILEVPNSAPQHEIHRAYQRAKETYSQDNPALYTMFSPQEARELMRMVEEAYSVLSNLGLRRAYDENLAKGKAASPYAAPPSISAPVQTAPAPHTMAQVESVHQSLPDFDSPTTSSASNANGAVEVKPNISNAQKANSLPPGTARTSLSTYSINAEIEKEIAEASEFDGQFLKKVRTYKSISLDRLSEATRVSRSYLTAVEENDFKSLPAAVFVRGFVMQMARLLGLDETKVTSGYMKNFKAGGGK